MYFLIAPALVLAGIIYLVLIYNGLVNCKNNVAKAWANIDVLLKQRHDELPKLIDTCKQYMQFEQETLEKVIKARGLAAKASQAQNLRAMGAAEGLLMQRPGLFVRLGRILSRTEIQRTISTSASPDYRAGEHHRRPSRVL